MSDFPDRIMYADDEKAMQSLVRDIIESHSSDVLFVGCETGQELINTVSHIKPKLILLDLKMPDMNGPDTVARLRADPQHKDIPVIFMTAVTDVEMTDEYKKMGVIGVIHKPFAFDSLAFTIEKIWKGREGA